MHTGGGFEGLFGCAVLIALFTWPGLIWWPLAFALPLFLCCAELVRRRRDATIARTRDGESICHFARSFDFRKIDTWIIRAVYEAFSERYPIRAEDSLLEDLLMDDEDLEFDVAAVADRVGRSLDDAERNPFVRLETVRDLVMFLQHQPNAR